MKDEKKRVAFLSVLAAVFLTVFKFAVGFATGSLGILSEALHSLLDFAAALITLFAVHMSGKPADKDHNFGHGKIENLSALIETLLLLLTCAWIIYEAVNRLVTGENEILVNVWSYAVVITSIVVDATRSRALMRAAKKHKSQALEADALHFSTDIWSSSVVLVGLIFSQFGIFWADCVAALFVAAIVIWISYRLFRRSIFALLDGVKDEDREQVGQIISGTSGVLRFHSLRMRTVGPEVFIDVNIHVDPTLSIVEAHDIATRVEHSLKKVCGCNCTASVHVEPEF